ncbi:FRG domain-containing protein [Sphingomonas hylomeconis]|uniref:FRG domain-containing protein n=1 Tax=Sphingomonas hylomeconis TaxID=1395958 RepID=A0ABV7SQT2_9SPHN|nr:FRG domain-containing protein [Sphingomonas hylomeconis]
MNPIMSLSDFIAAILGRGVEPTRLSTFRGHANEIYTLSPSIFRRPITRESEHLLLRELVSAHPEDFVADASALEMLVRMQHYSLPTRLLDVSMNPLVALYFACESAKKRVTSTDPRYKTQTVEADGQVIILTVDRNRIRYFDSDKVSCIANLARLRHDLKDKIDTFMPQDDFNADLPIKRLLHFVRQEKAAFEPEIIPADLNDIVLVKPKQSNKRILAQAGAFFAFGLLQELIDGNRAGIAIERLTIQGDKKGDILKDLDKLGINEKTLFPEIDRAARYLTESLSTGVAASRIISAAT